MLHMHLRRQNVFCRSSQSLLVNLEHVGVEVKALKVVPHQTHVTMPSGPCFVPSYAGQKRAFSKLYKCQNCLHELQINNLGELNPEPAFGMCSPVQSIKREKNDTPRVHIHHLR